MKKVFKFIILAIIGSSMLSCGGSSENKSNNILIEPTDNYKTACEEGDFQKAYKIVAELKTTMQDYQNEHASLIGYGPGTIGAEAFATYENLKLNYEEAERYVVLQEAISIIENQGIEGLPKIAFMVKEHNAIWVYNDLIDMAVAMGDETLEARLKKLANPKK